LESGNREVFAFGRRSGNREVALIVLNMSATTQKLNIQGMSGDWPRFHEVLMASPPADAPATPSFSLAPFGVLITATE
jgi:hypothetical protein